jgi:hypothetical protein
VPSPYAPGPDILQTQEELCLDINPYKDLALQFAAALNHGMALTVCKMKSG